MTVTWRRSAHPFLPWTTPFLTRDILLVLISHIRCVDLCVPRWVMAVSVNIAKHNCPHRQKGRNKEKSSQQLLLITYWGEKEYTSTVNYWCLTRFSWNFNCRINLATGKHSVIVAVDHMVIHKHSSISLMGWPHGHRLVRKQAPCWPNQVKTILSGNGRSPTVKDLID